MKTKHIEITVADLVKGYHEDGEIGVVGYNGKLDIRPPYQRNFVYKEAQRNAVINSVRRGLPINSMHWEHNNVAIRQEILSQKTQA